MSVRATANIIASSRQVGLPALVFAAGACAGTDQRGVAPTVRDSAGIQIIQTAAPALQHPEYHLEDTPGVQIGAVEGSENQQLFQVRGARSLSDGSILILNAGTHEVRLYDTDGQWLSSSGRKGGGPGEFEFPLAFLRWGPDTTLIYDFGLRRLNVVDSAGRIVNGRSSVSSLSGLVGFLDSATAVVADPRLPRNVYEQVVTAEVIVGLVDIGTGKTDTLEVLPGFQEYRYTVGELVRSVRVPYTSMPAVAVHNGLIYVTDGRRPEIRIYDDGGELRRIVRIAIEAELVDEDAWSSAARLRYEARIHGGSTGEGRLAPNEAARLREVYSALPRPETKPFFDNIEVSGTGEVWLRHYAEVGSDQRWTKLNNGGQAVATAVVHPAVRVLEISDSSLLGHYEDELGVEYIVRYALREAGDGS